MEYQSKQHKKSVEAKMKSIQEWQKSPLTPEERQRFLDEHFEAHNQVNPNKKQK